ncbi:MAG: choice-of-anchor Q domain-containing protein [Microcella sp.]|nr:choice-of-anchor Q domain-containing protein [Microcella sp.]
MAAIDADQLTGSAFRVRRVRRASSFVALGGLLASAGALAAAPVYAAEPSDCVDDGSASDNTLTAPGDDNADIQALLDADAPLICLNGTFDISSTLTLDHEVTFASFTGAVLDGGGDTQIVYSDSTENVIFEGMTLQNGSAFDGAAVRAYTVVAIDSVFQDNSADIAGAISAYALLTIDSSFIDNASEFDFGGAVLAQLVLGEGSTFEGNTSGGSGGAIYAYEVVDLETSTFLDNEADDLGGAIRSEDYVDITNSTFVGNTAGVIGGAIEAPDGRVTFSSFVQNSAGDGDGDSLASEFGMEIRGNIFASTTSTSHLIAGESFTDLAGNLFTTTAAQEVESLPDSDESSLFGLTMAQIFGSSTPSAADNGGPSETVALVSGSPAIDAVPPLEPSPSPTATIVSEPTDTDRVDDRWSDVDISAAEIPVLEPADLEVETDQRGEPRVAWSDAGAYEFGEAEAGNELADTGAGSAAASVLGGFAALLLGIGAAFAIGTRRISRSGR